MSRPASEVDGSRLTTAQRGDLARSVVAIGKIEPISKVEIKSKANGIIKEIKVQISDVVEEGQILVELDNENLRRDCTRRAALLGAQANVKAAQAELEKNKIEAEGVDIVFARRNRDRAERLAKDGLVPQSNLDDSRMAVEVAENRHHATKAQLSVAQGRVCQEEAAVARSEAAVERAEEQLSNAAIRSPIEGMVLSRDVAIGSPVSSILNLGAGETLAWQTGAFSINTLVVIGVAASVYPWRVKTQIA